MEITALVMADGTEQAAQPAAGDQQSEGEQQRGSCSCACGDQQLMQRCHIWFRALVAEEDGIVG
jgi:hypothetical protein